MCGSRSSRPVRHDIPSPSVLFEFIRPESLPGHRDCVQRHHCGCAGTHSDLNRREIPDWNLLRQGRRDASALTPAMLNVSGPISCPWNNGMPVPHPLLRTCAVSSAGVPVRLTLRGKNDQEGPGRMSQLKVFSLP